MRDYSTSIESPSIWSPAIGRLESHSRCLVLSLRGCVLRVLYWMRY